MTATAIPIQPTTADAAPRATPRRLRALVSRYWRHYLVGTLALVLVDLCDVALPFVLKHAIDDIVLLRGLLPLLAVGGVYLGFVLVQGGYRYYWRHYYIGVSHRIANELRNRLFAHLERLPPSYFSAQRTGDLMSRGTSDLEAVRQLFSMGFLLVVDTSMYLLVIPPVMLLLSPRLTFWAMIPMVMIPLFVWRMGKVVHERFRRVQDIQGDMTAAAEETISGVRVVKSFAQESRQVERFRALNERSVSENLRLAKAQGLFQPFVSMAMSLGVAVVILVGGRAAIRGEISLGDFVAFQHYLGRLVWPMQAVGMTMAIFQRGLASQQRIDEVLDVQPTIADGRATRAGLSVERGDVELRALTYRYPTIDRPSTIDRQPTIDRPGAPSAPASPARAALQDVSIRIPAGSLVALVGPVGAGKSTLLNLVPRLLDAPAGTVLVDGHDVREIPLAALRGAIGYVPQETFLFAETIGENVSIGRPQASKAEIEAACEAAHVLGEIARVPGGLDAKLGERGVNLSGGQRQRLAIARALLRKPRILLFDDCLSAVDVETEAAILKGIRAEAAGRTCIIASHRLSAVQHADEIIVLDAGRVVERGRHEALLQKGGLYSELWARQKLEQVVESA